jgi:hypothetical protein
MHVHVEPIKIEELIESEPLSLKPFVKTALWALVAIGLLTFTLGFFMARPDHLWATYYVNFVFFTGLSVGGVMITAIFQIVRAQWSPPVRRIAEANVAFLPWAFLFFLISAFGAAHIFPWATAPMPGREFWMQPGFVYGRFVVLLLILFSFMIYFVSLSLRGDVALLKERASNKRRWSSWLHDRLSANWRGAEEIPDIQRRLSILAPVLVIAYALIYSLFGFEMIMSMDTLWYANMFGGFMFIGNIYIGWAFLSFTVIYFALRHKAYGETVSTNHLWDLGKLTFGFCMLWGYMFFSHFLPQWYGNLPEETQWLILRVREYPWKGLGWVTFSLCFLLPFILLLSRSLKKTPWAFATVCVLPFIGVWLEKYMLIMPQFFPEQIPLGLLELGMFLGFLGVYILSVSSFLSRFPFIPISHPLTRGSTDW